MIVVKQILNKERDARLRWLLLFIAHPGLVSDQRGSFFLNFPCTRVPAIALICVTMVTGACSVLYSGCIGAWITSDKQFETIKQYIYQSGRHLFTTALDVVFYDLTTFYFDSEVEEGALLQKASLQKKNQAVASC